MQRILREKNFHKEKKFLQKNLETHHYVLSDSKKIKESQIQSEMKSEFLREKNLKFLFLFTFEFLNFLFSKVSSWKNLFIKEKKFYSGKNILGVFLFLLDWKITNSNKSLQYFTKKNFFCLNPIFFFEIFWKKKKTVSK